MPLGNDGRSRTPSVVMLVSPASLELNSDARQGPSRDTSR